METLRRLMTWCKSRWTSLRRRLLRHRELRHQLKTAKARLGELLRELQKTEAGQTDPEKLAEFQVLREVTRLLENDLRVTEVRRRVLVFISLSLMVTIGVIAASQIRVDKTPIEMELLLRHFCFETQTDQTPEDQSKQRFLVKSLGFQRLKEVLVPGGEATVSGQSIARRQPNLQFDVDFCGQPCTLRMEKRSRPESGQEERELTLVVNLVETPSIAVGLSDVPDQLRLTLQQVATTGEERSSFAAPSVDVTGGVFFDGNFLRTVTYSNESSESDDRPGYFRYYNRPKTIEIVPISQLVKLDFSLENSLDYLFESVRVEKLRFLNPDSPDLTCPPDDPDQPHRSAVLTGRILFDDLGTFREIRIGEDIHFEESKGEIRSLEVSPRGLLLRFRGQVSGMTVGTHENRQYVMPTYLQRFEKEMNVGVTIISIMVMLFFSIILVKL